MLFATAESSHGEKERLGSSRLLQMKKLLQLRAAPPPPIVGVARKNRASCLEEKSLGNDPADTANDAYDRDLALALVSQEHDALYEIDDALYEIDEALKLIEEE